MQHADYYQDRLQSHIVIDGLTYPLPRYYKQKLFNKTELKKIGNENLVIRAKSEAKSRLIMLLSTIMSKLNGNFQQLTISTTKDLLALENLKKSKIKMNYHGNN